MIIATIAKITSTYLIFVLNNINYNISDILDPDLSMTSDKSGVNNTKNRKVSWFSSNDSHIYYGWPINKYLNNEYLEYMF